ncbi:MAG: hypothetical protein DWQ04_31995 [Chloroflexi bacterium]|nr:MAG: hypothetical protein DWQ04_31995 [Chloroflexota bacterium]
MQNRKRLSILLALVVLVGTSIAVAAFMIPSAAELLVLAMETTETITDGHAIAEFEVDTPEQDGTGTLEVWGKLDVGPNGEPGFRMQVLNADEPEMVGITAVSDGTQFWLYNPTENKVLTATFEEMKARAEAEAEARAENGDFDHDSFKDEFSFEGFPSDFDPESFEKPETPEEAVAMLLEYFTADRTGNEDVGSSSAYTIRLVPIPEMMPDEVRAAGGYVNVWIRRNDTAFLGVEYAEGSLGSGKAVATTLELNDGVDESLFTFEIPAGAEVVNAAELEMPEHAEFAAMPDDYVALTPSDLPADAALDEELSIRGAAVQRYTLAEGGSFSVAQGPAGAAPNSFGGDAGETVTVRGVEGVMFADAENGRSLLTWVENDVTFWIGGDLTSEQALAIAESLQ